jgi:hypothetical protein
MKNPFFFLFFLLPIQIFSQPVIDVAGDDWAGKVSQSLHQIKTYDEASYNVIIKSVDRVSFWMGGFSSNVITKEGERTILISTEDIRSNSINNISAILVHESIHLWIGINNVDLQFEDEEILCYTLEMEHLRRIPNIEPWLIQHAETQIKKYQKQKTHK